MAQRGTTAKIDMAELERLSAMQWTDEEISAWFGISTRTIERRRKNARFAEVMDRGKTRGRISVRRMQMKLLEHGNATMGVWSGKNILKQTDAVQHQIKEKGKAGRPKSWPISNARRMRSPRRLESVDTLPPRPDFAEVCKRVRGRQKEPA